MSTAIMTKEAHEVEVMTSQKLGEYLKNFGLAAQLSKEEAAQFIDIAQAYNLNPFKREIYCVPYGRNEKRKLSILTGFEVYLKRAERSGLLDGWRVWTEGEIKPHTEEKKLKGRDGDYTKTVTTWRGNLKAMIEIYRKDRSRPFIHEVIFSEYAQDNEMWGGKPQTMIKKVAMAQGFRLCFPDELGGIPYTPDETNEYDQASIDRQQEPAPDPAKGKPLFTDVQTEPINEPAKPKEAQAEAAKPKAEGKPVQTPEDAEFMAAWHDAAQAIAAIVGAKDNPDGWTQEQREAVDLRALTIASRDSKDLNLMSVALARVTKLDQHRGKPSWADALSMVLAAGTDPDAIMALPFEAEPKSEQMEIF
jgi:phage recombination protein Bet